jgi:hypothetical protein
VAWQSYSIFFLGLPIVIAPIMFFAKEHIWIGAGIVTAILVNMGIMDSISFSLGQ